MDVFAPPLEEGWRMGLGGVSTTHNAVDLKEGDWVLHRGIGLASSIQAALGKR